MEIDTNRYSVPWSLIGEPVQVSVTDGELRVHHAGRGVASHPDVGGRCQVRFLSEYLQAIVGFRLPKADIEGAVAQRGRGDLAAGRGRRQGDYGSAGRHGALDVHQFWAR